jgi:PKD repeat protein
MTYKNIVNRILPFFLCWLLLSANISAQVKPNDITGLSLWLSADSVQQNNPPFVNSVYDLSTSANPAVQTISSKQPLWVPSVLNGHAILRFDGSDDFLQFTSVNDIRTVFWVIKEDANATANFRLLLGHSSNFDFYRAGTSIWAGPNTNTNILNGETKLNKVIVDGVITPVPTNFSLISIVTTGNVTAENLSIDRNISDRVWDGDFAELIVYNKALSPSEVLQIEEYVQNKYAPPVSLGPNTTVCSLPFIISAKQNHFKSYTWQDASTADTLVVNTPGTYSVTTVDIFGTVSSDTIIIAQDNSNYAVSLGDDSAICFGQQITLNAGLPHLTYLWSNNFVENSILVDSTGSYSVSVTNCLGNVSFDTINITVNPLPVFSLGADRILCYNGDKVLDPGSFSSANGYSFLWSDNSMDSSFIVNNSGNYSLTLTDSLTCFYSDTVNLTIDSSLYSISLGPDLSLCSGNSIFLTNSPSAALNYLWSDLSNNDSLLISATSGSAQYWVRVSNANFCNNSDTIVVTVNGVAPSLNFLAANACWGDSILFSNLSSSQDSIVSRIWDFGDTTSSGVISPIHLYADTGVYQVRLTETTFIGCSASLVKMVQVFPEPIANFSIADSLFTDENILFLDLSNPLGYPISQWTWNFGDITSGNANTSSLHYPYHIFQDTGTYHVQLLVENVHGCTDTIQKFIRIKSEPLVVITDQPSDFPGLRLWLNADSVKLAAGTQKVEKLIDLASGANPALQVDTARQPLLKPLVLNQHNVMQFDGTDDFVQFKAVNDIRTVLWVLKEDVNAVIGYRLLLGDSVSFDFYRDNTFIWAGANVNPNVLNGETRLNSQVVNGQSAAIPNNYALISLVTTANVEADNFTYDRLNAGRVWDGDLAELVVYNQALSSADLVKVENYLKNKYAKPINLGNDRVVCSFPFTLKAATNYFKSYLWQDLSTADSLVVNSPGTYSITVTDIFGRVSLDTVNVLLDNSKYIVNFGADMKVCEGSPLFLNAGPSHLSYTWSTLANGSILQVDTSGIYAVTVTDCLGNISSDSIRIDFNELPVFDLGFDTLICYNQDFKLRTALNVSQTNLYNFVWSTGSTDSTLVPVKSGVYTLKVSDSIGCSYSDAIAIQVDSLLYPATLGNDTSFCSGNFIQLWQGAAAVSSFLWSDNSMNPSLQVIQPIGTNYFYTLELTDSNGCKKLDSIYVDITGIAPSIAFNFDTSLCIGVITQFIDFSVAPIGDTVISWEWNFGDSTMSQLQNPSHLYATPGKYEVQLKISTTEGCSALLTKEVNIYPFPIANFTNPSACEQNELSFTNTSNTFGNLVQSYSWNFGDTTSGTANFSTLKNPKHIFTSRDTFEVKLVVTTIYGCSDSITKTIITKPSPKANFSDTIACEGYLVNLSDISTYPFPQFALSRSWNFNDGSAIQNSTQQLPLTTVTHQYSGPGNYFTTLSILASNGCRDSVRKNIYVVSKPKADFSYTKNCLNGFTEFFDISTQNLSFQVDSIVSWKWTLAPGVFSTLKNPTYRYTSFGAHTVELIVRTLRGCSDTIQKTIFVKALPLVAFTKSASAGDPPLSVDFTNASANEVTVFQWSFGDSTSSLDENPTHTYNDTGLFTIVLIGTDTSGCVGSATQSVFIKQALIDIALIALNSTIDDQNYLHVKADLQNKSTRIINSIELSSQINGQSGIREKWTGELPINGYLTYNFVSSSKVEQYEPSSYVCVQAIQPNSLVDYFPDDNSLCDDFGESEFSLANPFPNPTSGSLILPFVLPEEGVVSFKLYDSKGSLVIENVLQVYAKGLNQLQLDMTAYRSGVYGLQLSFKGKSISKLFCKTNQAK